MRKSGGNGLQCLYQMATAVGWQGRTPSVVGQLEQVILLTIGQDVVYFTPCSHNLDYPLEFTFKTLALAPQFTVTDRQGRQVAFIKQKLFKLKEEVKVFQDDSQREVIYHINADRWLDWSASYAFTTADGKPEGRVARQGMRSMWKAHYDVVDAAGVQQFTIRERSAATRFFDNMLGEVPIIGLFTGYLFNPTYDVRRVDGELVGEFKKMPSGLGRRFMLQMTAPLNPEDEPEIILSLMMMVLLERRRG